MSDTSWDDVRLYMINKNESKNEIEQEVLADWHMEYEIRTHAELNLLYENNQIVMHSEPAIGTIINIVVKEKRLDKHCIRDEKNNPINFEVISTTDKMDDLCSFVYHHREAERGCEPLTKRVVTLIEQGEK